MQALEEDLADDPAEALPQLHDLVLRMLEARGYDIGDPVADDGDDPEVLREYRAARDVTLHVERGDDSVGPGDVASAIEGLRAVYDHLISNRGAP